MSCSCLLSNGCECRAGSQSWHVQDVTAGHYPNHHRGIRRLAVCFPHWAAVEGLQRMRPHSHIGEASQPYKPIWIIKVPELADDTHSQSFLAFDELSIEQIDESIPHPWMQRILPQLND